MTRIHKNYYEIYVSFIIIVTGTGYVRYKIGRVVTPDLQLARQTENIFFPAPRRCRSSAAASSGPNYTRRRG